MTTICHVTGLLFQKSEVNLILPAIVCLFVLFNQAIHGDRMSRP